MEIKKTLVVGGSPRPSRYSNMAIRKLRSNGHEVVSIGRREAKVGDVIIQEGRPAFSDIHTITMYVGPGNQSEFADYLLDLNAKRIIFNPGTENDTFAQKASEKDIQVIYNCTLVMLDQGLF